MWKIIICFPPVPGVFFSPSFFFFSLGRVAQPPRARCCRRRLSIELPADLLSVLSAARSCLRAAASRGCGVRCLENRHGRGRSKDQERRKEREREREREEEKTTWMKRRCQGLAGGTPAFNNSTLITSELLCNLTLSSPSDRRC